MNKSACLTFFSLIVLLCFSGTVTAQATRYTVQLEAAPSLEVAQEKIKQFKSQGLDAYVVKSQVPGKGTFYRVRVGMFPSQAEARKYGTDLQKQGVVREFFIAAYERPVDETTPANPAVAGPAPKPVNATPEDRPKTQSKEPPAQKPEVKEPPKEAIIAKNNPTSVVNAVSPTPVSTTAASAAGINFVKFQDTIIGYSFDRPQYWEGGPLDTKDVQDQKVNAGALFKSYKDAAFISAIWNNLDKANSPDNDNDLIVELILRSMGSGDDTQQMSETSRKVVSENGTIKTFLDLRATFKVQGQDGPLDFLGKAVIVRVNKGILLVVAFYAKTGPPYVATVAERIIASVRPPE